MPISNTPCLYSQIILLKNVISCNNSLHIQYIRYTVLKKSVISCNYSLREIALIEVAHTVCKILCILLTVKFTCGARY